MTLVKEGSGRGKQEDQLSNKHNPHCGEVPKAVRLAGKPGRGRARQQLQRRSTPQDSHSEDAAWILIHK